MGKMKKNEENGGEIVVGSNLPQTYHNGGENLPHSSDWVPSTEPLKITEAQRPEMAVELKRLNGELVGLVNRVIIHAVQSGRVLSAVKATFPEARGGEKGGGFYDWVRDHVGYSKTTAVRYEKAWENYARYKGEGKAEILSNLTLGALIAYNPDKPPKSQNESEVIEEEVVMEAEVSEPSPTPEGMDIMSMVFQLTPAQEKRAMETAAYFGGSELAKQQARKWVWDRIPSKSTTATSSTMIPTVVKRTIRYNPVLDGYIQNVSRRTGRSYNEVNEELARVGLARFKKKHGLS